VPAAGATNEPQRRCVGCGRSASKRDLLRLVQDAGRAIPDPAQRLPGRGAYVCREAACVERAVRRGGLARSFRRPVSIAPERLLEELATPPAGRPASGAGESAFSHNLLESIC
jgi:uncharacterized protein